MSAAPERKPRPLQPLTRLIFASRWLQVPLYLGLILIEAALGNQDALMTLVKS
jgi:uncharacterized membrane protein YqhA